MYGGTVWFNGIVKLPKVLQVQREPLLNIDKCYRTVASRSLCVLAGCTSIDLVFEMYIDIEDAIYVIRGMMIVLILIVEICIIT